MRAALAAMITLPCAAGLMSATLTAARASPHPGAQAGVTRPGAQPGVTRPGTAQPGRARDEHFRIVSTTAGSRRQSVVATGQFTAGGYVVPGRLAGLRVTDKMVFRRGTFLVYRAIRHQSLPLPTSGCLIRETLRGTYVIGHGTGAFRGISGSGGFSQRITGVIRRSGGKCGGPMTVFQQITYEGGRVRR